MSKTKVSVDKKLEDQVTSMRKENKTYKEISKDTKLDRFQIYDILKKSKLIHKRK